MGDFLLPRATMADDPDVPSLLDLQPSTVSHRPSSNARGMHTPSYSRMQYSTEPVADHGHSHSHGGGGDHGHSHSHGSSPPYSPSYSPYGGNSHGHSHSQDNSGGGTGFLSRTLGSMFTGTQPTSAGGGMAQLQQMQQVVAGMNLQEQRELLNRVSGFM